MPHYSAVVLVSVFLLCSCSGGGGSSGPAVQTGVFLDSEVSQLHYEGQSNSGFTNSAGQFSYNEGEVLTFSLGGISLGSATGSQELTPFDLLGISTLDEAREGGIENELTNIVLFLQSLDRDQNPENGIDLEGLDAALAGETLDFTGDVPSFLNGDYRRIINQNGGHYRSSKSALNHLLSNLDQSIDVLLLDTLSTDFDGNGSFESIIRYGYTDMGRLALLDRVNGITDEIESSTSFEYDAAGNLVLEKTGQLEIEYGYDPLFGLLRKTVRSDGEVSSFVEFAYDSVGNLIRSEDTRSLRLPTFSFSPPLVDVGEGFPSFAMASDQIFMAGQPVLVSAGEPISSFGRDFGLAPTLLFADASSPGGELTERVLLVEYQYDENGNRILAIDSSSLDATGPSTTRFSYEDNRVVDIVTTGSGFDRKEIHIEYDADGHLLSCQRDMDGVLQDQYVPPDLLINFPQAGDLPGIGDYIEDCTNSVEYDDQGRATRIEQAATSFFPGYVQEIEYLADKIVLIRVDANMDSEFERFEEFDYLATGELSEHRIIRDGEIVFRVVREYKSMELPAIP